MMGREFTFDGEISSSKSLYNRALIIQSLNPYLKIAGESQADDVLLMKQAITQLLAGQEIDCGHAGTVLRFMALRAAREKGTHILTGSERLFSRPQNELIPVLNQLGVDAEIKANQLKIRSNGWRLSVDGLHIHSERSSQFASAVVLSAWGLNFTLPFLFSKKMVSEGYFQMTLQLARELGMHVSGRGHEFVIKPGQKVLASECTVEPDFSSAFAVAALAVVAGSAKIRHLPLKSLQPDAIFIKILTDMGVDLRHTHVGLEIKKTKPLRGIEIDLSNSPDLFPVLAVLCTLATGPSKVSGIGHLKFKESSRLHRTQELVAFMGGRIEGDETSVTIHPTDSRPVGEKKRIFSADQDHRMAMAARVAEWAGFPVQVDDMAVVQKSFPEFMRIAARETGLE